MEKAEFDKFAEEYHALHAATVSASGETPQFFHEYKIADVRRLLARTVEPSAILDFGAGVGNSIPFFKTYFPNSELICSDVSEKSLAHAESRFPGMARRALIENDRLPLPNESVDLAFSACVFHHIPHEAHQHWFRELLRVTRPGGRLVIFEHNPITR